MLIQINIQEYASLRFQTGTSKAIRGGRRYLPYVFTQEGVAMLSSVLHSQRAVEVNIIIMRVFVKLRELMLSHKDLAQKIERLEEKFKNHDENFVIVFKAIKKLLEAPKEIKKKKSPIGFHAG